MDKNQETEDRGGAGQPSYYGWRDERSPYAVELNLSLVPKIIADLEAAEQLGQEAGGILVGSFPPALGLPALRIDEYELVGRRGVDGLPYVLVAEQRTRFTTIRKRVATREKTALGYFRSHLRTGPFELTVTDRDLLAAEFKNSIHVAMLVAKDQSTVSRSGGAQRYLATFFVSVNGIIQNRVDPVTFPFEAELLEKLSQTIGRLHPERLLPKPLEGLEGLAGFAPEPAPGPQAETGGPEVPRSKGRRLGIAGLIVFCLLCGLFVAWGWRREGTHITGPLFLGETGLNLTVHAEGPAVAGRTLLHIDWNHQSPVLLDAVSGHLTLTNDQTHAIVRELDLSPRELTEGRVDVELDEQPVAVLLALSMADSTRVAQEAKAITGAEAR